MEHIVTLTLSPTIDISSHIDHVVPEHKLRCDMPVTEPGGGGVNVARALRRFGTDPLAMFTVGGHTGRRLVDLVEQERVRTLTVPISGVTRENFTIREDVSTLQYRFCMPGPTLTDAEWQLILATLEGFEPKPDLLVASGSLPPGLPVDAYAQIAELAKQRDIRMILDTSGPALEAALDSGLYMVKPNLAELASLEGDTWIEDEEHLRAATTAMVNERDCESVVVSLGAAGAIAVTRDASVRIPAPPVRPESKVGAGDSMVAGIVWGLTKGWSILEAASLGVAAGASAVKSPGSDLCYQQDTERLYAQMFAYRLPSGVSS